MTDQAQALRTLMEQRRALTGVATSSDTPTARVLGLTSAKGGVGKTTLALQSALVLAEAGQKVCVWDVDGNAAHDLLAGFHHSWSITHLLTGARSADEVLATGPAGIQFLLGTGVQNVTAALTDRSGSLAAAVSEWERKFDVIILDLPSVGSPGVRTLIEAAHLSWLVCTPEPAAVAASYACLKHDPSLLSHVSLLVNQVTGPDVAFDVIDRWRQTTRMFLLQECQTAGYIPQDRYIEAFGHSASDSPSVKELNYLIARWLGSTEGHRTTFDNFLKRLCQRDHRPIEYSKGA